MEGRIGLLGLIMYFVSPFVDASGEKILVLLSASVKRFGVSRMRDFFLYVQLRYHVKSVKIGRKKTIQFCCNLKFVIAYTFPPQKKHRENREKLP